jgi:hypothetical protein
MEVGDTVTFHDERGMVRQGQVLEVYADASYRVQPAPTGADPLNPERIIRNTLGTSPSPITTRDGERVSFA